MITEECCACGVIFGLTKQYQDNVRKTKDSFFCPNGHPQHYTRNEADRLREKLDAQVRETTRLAEKLRRETETNDKLERTAARLKKRIAAGVCPCCHRTVSQMAKHMKTKHPKYITENSSGKNKTNKR